VLPFTSTLTVTLNFSALLSEEFGITGVRGAASGCGEFGKGMDWRSLSDGMLAGGRGKGKPLPCAQTAGDKQEMAIKTKSSRILIRQCPFIAP